MDTTNDTLIQRKNKHLNAYERGQIQLLNREGLTPYAIGIRIGRASNTIRNELGRGTVSQLKCNKVVNVYYPDTGQAVYEKNRLNCGPRYKFLSCSKFFEHVETLFRDKNTLLMLFVVLQGFVIFLIKMKWFVQRCCITILIQVF